jgi:AraC-like DNA-binding protein
MVAIRSGRGIVEWKDDARKVGAGTVFFLLPGDWHRYRPDKFVGWVEEWVELRGPLLDRWVGAGLFGNRVVPLARPRTFFEAFGTLHRLASRGGQDGPTCPAQMLGAAILLLSQAVAAPEKGEAFRAGTRIERLVERAGEALREGLGVAATARALGISYPTLRRYFLTVRGISPKQASTQVRRARAETLLAEGQLSVKEIAAVLGYHSASHFSLTFKRDNGVSPSAWRAKQG